MRLLGVQMRKLGSRDARQGKKLPQPPADLNNMHTGAGRRAESLLAEEAVKMMTGLTIAGGIGRTTLMFLELLFQMNKIFCCSVCCWAPPHGFTSVASFRRKEQNLRCGGWTDVPHSNHGTVQWQPLPPKPWMPAAPLLPRCLPAPGPVLPQLHLPAPVFRRVFGLLPAATQFAG